MDFKHQKWAFNQIKFQLERVASNLSRLTTSELMTKNFIQKMATKRFAPKLKVKTGDTVVVTAGKDKGKKGTILRVFPTENLAVVEGIQMVTKHRKPTQTSEGGISQMEARINISNLMLVDGQGNPTRVGRRVEDGKVVRYSKKSGQTIQ